MDGHLDLGGVSGTAAQTYIALDAVRLAFSAALREPDVRRARRELNAAIDGGAPLGPVYVSVIRPTLRGLQGADPVRTQLAREIGETLLGDLVARLPTRSDGRGRAALLSARSNGIEAVDGNVAMDFLDAAGWRISRIDGDHDPEASLDRAVRAGRIELAVAVTAGPEDALRLAPICTSLRRLADPPVILLCDFSGVDHRAALNALSADAWARNPEELVALAAEHLPANGQRRWGVQIVRAGATLTLAPTGRLDAVSASRLADVAISRSGSFRTLRIDLRELAEIDRDGIQALSAWERLLPLDGIEVAAVLDAETAAMIAVTGASLGLAVAS